MVMTMKLETIRWIPFKCPPSGHAGVQSNEMRTYYLNGLPHHPWFNNKRVFWKPGDRNGGSGYGDITAYEISEALGIGVVPPYFKWDGGLVTRVVTRAVSIYRAGLNTQRLMNRKKQGWQTYLNVRTFEHIACVGDYGEHNLLWSPRLHRAFSIDNHPVSEQRIDSYGEDEVVELWRKAYKKNAAAAFNEVFDEDRASHEHVAENIHRIGKLLA